MIFISCIILGAVLKLTGGVILPFTVAAMLAMIVYPVVKLLTKIKIPKVISITLAALIVVAGMYLIGVALFSAGRQIMSVYPRYESRLLEIYIYVARFFELSYNENLNFIDNLWGQLGIRTWLRGFALSFSNITINFLKNAFLSVLFMVFLLVEAGSFKTKLEIAFADKSSRIMKILNDIVRQVSRYIVAKFFISLSQGVLFIVFLKWIGVEFAVLWGLFQFIMNFIPNIGSIAAGVCVSAFTLIQFWPNPTPVILVIVMVLLVNNVIGNILDPKIVGDRVGISALVILISLVIWGWIWGFTGMILAVPMTVSIRIVCENIPFLEPVSIMLGTRKAAMANKTKNEKAEADSQAVEPASDTSPPENL